MWWHTVTHRRGKWRGNWRMTWVASTLHTASEHGVSSITTADAHTSAASSRLNWRPCRFKWTRPFRRKTKSDFWACVPSHFKCCLDLQTVLISTDWKHLTFRVACGEGSGTVGMFAVRIIAHHLHLIFAHWKDIAFLAGFIALPVDYIPAVPFASMAYPGTTRVYARSFASVCCIYTAITSATYTWNT